MVNFFVNEADPTTADLVRDLRAETDCLTEAGSTVLEEVCTTGGEWDRARGAAGDAIAVAYTEYASTLEEMGLDPAPVC